MLASIRAALRRRGRRAVIVCVVVVLGSTVATAHTSPGDHHIGEAVAICLAVVATGAAAVAALPSLGRWVPGPPRAVDAARPALPWVVSAGPCARARGDPVLLGVLRL
jgi:hypothetical protein